MAYSVDLIGCLLSIAMCQDAVGAIWISRELHPLERFALQGFPPTIGAGLTRRFNAIYIDNV